MSDEAVQFVIEHPTSFQPGSMDYFDMASDLRNLREKARALDFIDVKSLQMIAEDPIPGSFNCAVSVVFVVELVEAINALRAELEQTTTKR